MAEQPKSGLKTTEFWVTIGAMAVPQLVESLPPTWRAVLSTAAGAVYAIARTLAKLGIGR